jgi:flagellar motility protein MotE (MotC chaperone)
MRLKPRLLHLLIAAAGAMLVLKVGAVWHEAGIAFAQTAPAQNAAAPNTPPPNAPAKPTSETPAKPAGEAKADGAPAPAGGEPLNPGAPKPSAKDSYTAAEVQPLLDQLAKQRKELDQRTDQLTQREALLTAAEQRVDEKIEQLKQMQATLDVSMGKVDAQEDQRLTSLVAIYTNMKPKEAAPILSELDMPVLLQLLTRMKDRNTSAIMAVMDPKKAQAITMALAERRQSAGTPPAGGTQN